MSDQNEVLRYVEQTMANPNGLTNDQLAAHLMEQCPTVDPALIKNLVLNEPQQFAADPTHQINWAAYAVPTPEEPDNTPAIDTEL